VLLLVPWPGRALDPASLLDHLRLRLPRWSLPDALVVLAALPRTGTGRIDRLALRRQYAGHLDGSLSTRA
jgi:acyl-CoA synthetase (AMP-forming)/AMP-acid ligase II